MTLIVLFLYVRRLRDTLVDGRKERQNQHVALLQLILELLGTELAVFFLAGEQLHGSDLAECEVG